MRKDGVFMKPKMDYVRVLLCMAITAGLYTTESFATWVNIYNNGSAAPITISQVNLAGCPGATLAPDMRSPVTIAKNTQASLANVLSPGTCIISFSAAAPAADSTKVTATGEVVPFGGVFFNSATTSRSNFYIASAAKTTIYVGLAICLSYRDWAPPGGGPSSVCVMPHDDL